MTPFVFGRGVFSFHLLVLHSVFIVLRSQFEVLSSEVSEDRTELNTEYCTAELKNGRKNAEEESHKRQSQRLSYSSSASQLSSVCVPFQDMKHNNPAAK